MDLIFVSIGLSIMLVFMFKIEWFFERRKFFMIFLYSIFLFCLYEIVLKQINGVPKTVVSFRMPLISIIIFFILFRFFKFIYKRNPENTFWRAYKMPIEDVIFTVLFFIFGVGMPFLLI